MKKLNDRCPLSTECERKECKYRHHELDCEYYATNAVGADRTIEDQEKLRREMERRREESRFEEWMKELDDDTCACMGCRNQSCICAGGKDADGRMTCDGQNNCMQTGCTYEEKHRQLHKGENQIVYIEVKKLRPHPANPRKSVGDVTELADSIRHNGIMQNLTVVPWIGEITHKPTGNYKVVIGNRRLAAAKLVGLERVPCVVEHMTDKQQISTMIAENMQRKDLTVLEEAEGIQMMLDMGETVGSIAQQTGLSETTVRRRIQIGRLDKKQVEAAEERGARLEDYERISRLESPAERECVLRFAGTERFEYQITAAEQRQEQKRSLDALEQEIRDGGWAQEMTPEEQQSLMGGTMEWTKIITANGKIHAPADRDEVRYAFRRDGAGINIYREKTAVPEVDQREARKKALRADMARIRQEVNAQDEIFRQLRRGFIQKFDRYARYREEIEAMAVRAMMVQTTGYSAGIVDQAQVMQTLGVSGQEQMEDVLRKAPERVLLAAAYERLEMIAPKYSMEKWSDDIGVFIPVAKKSAAMDLLYRQLSNLGYIMSPEEESAAQGSRIAFNEAAALVQKMKEENEC